MMTDKGPQACLQLRLSLTTEDSGGQVGRGVVLLLVEVTTVVGIVWKRVPRQ